MSTTQPLLDFAVITIFAREVLEGSIIIGEYRTIILRSSDDAFAYGITRRKALRAVNVAALVATVVALIVIAAIAIPLAVLSSSFEQSTAKIIEGVSKIVAGISLLQLSLKLPKWLGVYGSKKKKRKHNTERVSSEDEEAAPHEDFSHVWANAEPGERDREDSNRFLASWCPLVCRSCCYKDDNDAESSTHDNGDPDDGKLTLRCIRFNVAWNIWREVAECGVFLIPFFLTGQGIVAVPLSGLIGCAVGLLVGLGIYCANKRLSNKVSVTIFAVLLMVIFSAGLFTGGCHNLEVAIGSTKQVWELSGDFWSVDRLPMTILKPFGYNDSRTVLEMVCFWSWLVLAGLLHYRKYRTSPKICSSNSNEEEPDTSERQEDSVMEPRPPPPAPFPLKEEVTIEMGDSFESSTAVENQRSSSVGESILMETGVEELAIEDESQSPLPNKRLELWS